MISEAHLIAAARRLIGEAERIVTAERGEPDPDSVTLLIAVMACRWQRGFCPGHVRAAPVNLPSLNRTQRERREEAEPVE